MSLARKLITFGVLGFAGFLLCGGLSWIDIMLHGTVNRTQAFYFNTTFIFAAVLVVMFFGMWLIERSWSFSPKMSRGLLGLFAGFCLLFGGSWFLSLFV